MTGTDAPSTDRALYDELAAYTMSHGSSTFIHQHVVDAIAAQQATAATKPIALTFALVGLYLHLERSFTGRQVQRVHMLLANRTKQFPSFALPDSRGAITVRDVMAASAGAARDACIEAWCASVWDAFRADRAMLLTFLEQHDIT